MLHDVFGYPVAQVAEVTGRTPAACRQLASSAIRTAQTPAVPAARHAGIVRDFRRAWEAKDIQDLIDLLDPDAIAIADGGGLAGRTPGNLTILERTVNGQPGLVAQLQGIIVTVFAFDLAGDRIKHIWAVRNPDKLRPWTTA